eukprot:TRINITY_DN11957_c0_g1_i2.p1 TRINITY_DN11957_c0_g1~~TRINITY_DN11957_c0_g1_i2.p1  ORF type:complete len:275 (+),score=58.49 TRINITY_DN11957_c0_g1_i2:229-1053(+)
MGNSECQRAQQPRIVKLNEGPAKLQCTVCGLPRGNDPLVPEAVGADPPEGGGGGVWEACCGGPSPERVVAFPHAECRCGAGGNASWKQQAPVPTARTSLVKGVATGRDSSPRYDDWDVAYDGATTLMLARFKALDATTARQQEKYDKEEKELVLDTGDATLYALADPASEQGHEVKITNYVPMSIEEIMGSFFSARCCVSAQKGHGEILRAFPCSPPLTVLGANEAPALVQPEVPIAPRNAAAPHFAGEEKSPSVESQPSSKKKKAKGIRAAGV